MTSFDIREVEFSSSTIEAWAQTDKRFRNWPVVYTLDGAQKIYVGESLSVANRLRQHISTREKAPLERAHIVVDDTFNKSACLDLESFLIGLFAGEARYEVLNSNEGITNAEYFDRAEYQKKFKSIFEEFRARGLFSASLAEIQNSALYKLSPFKALSPDQLQVVESIVEGLLEDIEANRSSTSVIRGAPGTGKTVVGVFLMKLLADAQKSERAPSSDASSILQELLDPDSSRLLSGKRMGVVVPQQALRESMKAVFDHTPGLERSMVLSPFDVGEDRENFDILLVDEAHRLTQRASQGSGAQNRRYSEITTRLFGNDDLSKTQLDWILAKSRHQIFMIDEGQTIRPADISGRELQRLTRKADRTNNIYGLKSQLRVRAGTDYPGYIRSALTGAPVHQLELGDYDLRLYDDFKAMRQDIKRRDAEIGLARLVAGYAWKWNSKKNRHTYDIEIQGQRLRWNTKQVDWVTSKNAIDEMGSIHTVQGYDLNYAGVVIGMDLRFDAESNSIYFDRQQYHDRNGKANNKQLGIRYSDTDLLSYIRNIYTVLLTRGIRGTYIYVCDPPLREFLRSYFPSYPRSADGGGPSGDT